MRHHATVLPALLLLTATPVAAQTWTQRSPAQNPGNVRDGAMVFHATANHTILFGGWPTLNGTWLYDGSNWSQATPAATPPGRRDFAMSHDLTRGRTVLFGGQGSTLRNDTWEWDGANWTDVTPPGGSPSARLGHVMAYDIARSRTVLYGGTTNPNLPRTQLETWEWNGSAWTRVTTANAPAEAEYSSMCYDIGRAVCVLTGGTSFFGAPDQKTWEYNGIDWSDRTAGVGPGPTSTPGLGVMNARMVYDQGRGVCVLHGGRTPNGTFSTETWEYNGSAWTRVSTGTPSSRSGAQLGFDLGRGVCVLYGGSHGNLQTHYPETWEFQGAVPAAYAALGAGCPGSSGTISNTATALPRLGQTMAVQFGNLPAPQVAFVVVGLSSTMSAFGPLPFALGGLGAPGCLMRVSADASTLVLGSGGTASWSLALPNQPALSGARMHVQALALDPPANTLGAVVSAAATATLGS